MGFIKSTKAQDCGYFHLVITHSSVRSIAKFGDIIALIQLTAVIRIRPTGNVQA